MLGQRTEDTLNLHLDVNFPGSTSRWFTIFRRCLLIGANSVKVLEKKCICLYCIEEHIFIGGGGNGRLIDSDSFEGKFEKRCKNM